jgi:hypothetical protein
MSSLLAMYSVSLGMKILPWLAIGMFYGKNLALEDAIGFPRMLV